MQELIDVFRMAEISASTRIDIIGKLGQVINAKYSSNITEPLVEELTKQLCQGSKPRIIQILIGPEDAKYQGRMFGLDSDGKVWVAGKDGWTQEDMEFPS